MSRRLPETTTSKTSGNLSAAARFATGCEGIALPIGSTGETSKRTKGDFSPELAKTALKDGIGQIAVTANVKSTQQAVEFANAGQKWVRESTWDPPLLEEVFAATAREMRSRGTQQVLAPVLDLGRDPRWGRIEET